MEFVLKQPYIVSRGGSDFLSIVMRFSHDFFRTAQLLQLKVVVFLFHTMFLSFFASRIRHSFLRDLSMNQSLTFYLYSPRGAKVPFVRTKIPFMGVNKLRMECKKYQSRNGSIKDLPRETYHINSIHSPNVTNSCVRSFSSCLLRPDLHVTEVFFLNIFILIVLNLFKRNRIYNTFTKH